MIAILIIKWVLKDMLIINRVILVLMIFFRKCHIIQIKAMLHEFIKEKTKEDLVGNRKSISYKRRFSKKTIYFCSNK